MQPSRSVLVPASARLLTRTNPTRSRRGRSIALLLRVITDVRHSPTFHLRVSAGSETAVTTCSDSTA